MFYKVFIYKTMTEKATHETMTCHSEKGVGKHKLIINLLILSSLLVLSGNAQEVKQIKIGNQIWMAENLAVDTGDFATLITDSITMARQYLYSWETALKACPHGFRLPKDAEWDSLTAFFGGHKKAGIHLIGSGEGRFNASLAGNYLPSGGFFSYINDYGYYWTADKFNKKSVWIRVLGAHQTNIMRTTIPSHFYLSVRCIKD
jgi:uncharacterized protein (TIGR02145 family)